LLQQLELVQVRKPLVQVQVQVPVPVPVPVQRLVEQLVQRLVQRLVEQLEQELLQHVQERWLRMLQSNLAARQQRQLYQPVHQLQLMSLQLVKEFRYQLCLLKLPVELHRVQQNHQHS
jgi:hypothetical protein